MARNGINKTITIGNLGSDPEIRYNADGSPITSVNIAVSESWIDKQTKQKKERTEWLRVVFFNKLAEIAAQYLHKGSKVYIEGALRTRQWEKEGQKHYTTEIVANEMQMLDSRGAGAPQGAGQGGAQSSGGYDDFAPSTQQRAPQSEPAAASMDQFDDDIPF